LPEGTPANASALLQQSAQHFAPIILAAEQAEARIQTNGVEVSQQSLRARCRMLTAECASRCALQIALASPARAA